MSTVTEIANLVRLVPFYHTNRRYWRSVPKQIAAIVAAILSEKTDNRTKFLREIAKESGISHHPLYNFCRCRDQSNDHWVELQRELEALSVEWIGKKQKKSKQEEKTIPHTPLAVVAGNVTPITPIAPSKTMIADSGEFAKANTRRVTTIDPVTADITITTTTVKVIKFGSEEHRAYLINSSKQKTA